MKKDIKIFIDFDGTITKKDVGEGLFRKFGDPDKVDKIIDDLLQNRISAKQSWTDLCRSVNALNVAEWDSFIVETEIDEFFKEYVSFCNEQKIDFFVLSDGYDYYIDRILEKENLIGIKYFANRLNIINGKLCPEFPFEDPYSRSSANCKRNHIINNSSDDDITIYIGDGNSDIYAAQFCDYIFAKDSLLKYCEKERISFNPYRDFSDILLKTKLLVKKRNIKKRHQAELKRKEVYILEY